MVHEPYIYIVLQVWPIELLNVIKLLVLLFQIYNYKLVLHNNQNM